MASLRDGIEKAQFHTQPSTSVQEVAAKFSLQSPVSLLRVVRLLKPATLDWETGEISSGDDNLVKAGGHLSLTSTGSWAFSGAVTDSGDGATFAFAMSPNFVDAFGMTLFFAEADELNDHETSYFNKQGRDLWIARNWEAIRTNGFTWRLQASTDNTWKVVLGIVSLGILAVAGGAAAKCGQQNSWSTQQNSNGGTTAICTAK